MTRYRNMKSFHQSKDTRGFTLVELLVVIAIIGILIGMLVPAMQNMRELSRRSLCEQNLVNLSLALSAYSTQFGHYPIGSVNESGPIRSEAAGFHHNWISGLLPMLEAQPVFDAIDQSASVYADDNSQVRMLNLPMLHCPTATDTRENTTCYAGISSSIETPIDEDNDGAFRLNLPVAESDITDGLSHTLIVGEKLSAFDEDLGWFSGTRSSLRTTGHPINAERNRIRGPADPAKKVDVLYVGGLASDHLDGSYLLMGSGQYQFRSSSTDLRVLQQMAARADGTIPIEWEGTVGGPPTEIDSKTPADLTL